MKTAFFTVLLITVLPTALFSAGRHPKSIEFCDQKFSTTASAVICRNRKDVRDLTPLKNLQYLHTLDLSGTGVSNLRPLSKLEGIEVLHIQGSQVRDISVVENFENLEVLSLSATDVDLTPLRKLRFIEDLHISGTKLDLSSLAGAIVDHDLSISCDQVDLTPLKDIGSLEALTISSARPIDLTPLRELKEVDFITISSPELDLTPLKDLPAWMVVQVSDPAYQSPAWIRIGRDCIYQKESLLTPVTHRDVVVSVSVDPEGSVGAVVVSTTSIEPTVQKCLIEEIGKRRFPHSGGQTQIFFTCRFVLHHEND